MALVTQNSNESRWQPINETTINKKTIPYGSAKVSLNVEPIRDCVNLSNKSEEPLKEARLKQQVSFKGSPVKASSITNFFLGEAPVLAEKLLSDITRYIPPTLDNGLVHSLHYDVNNKKFGIVDELIRPTEPFHKNVIKGFTDLPRLIIRTAKRFIGSKQTKEKVEKEIKQSETRNLLLGLCANVTKIAEGFDKGITGENLGKLKNIVKDGITGKEEELSTFFKEKKLKTVYSFKDGKESGILCKDNNLEGFIKEILGEIPKSEEESFIEKVKKQYVQQTIDKKMESKQGAFLSSAGQSATSFVARAVSGIIPAWFIAHDFYNLKMAHSDDKKQAKNEWKSKFKQESGRIGIETYQGYIINSVFEKLTNKSLPFAVGLNIVNTIGSNVFSRKITGRPVLPINIDDAAKLKSVGDKKTKLATNSGLEENTAENLANDAKLNRLKSFNAFRNNNKSIGFGANNKGIINSLKSGLKVLDERFAQACPAKMDIEKFVENYGKVKEFDRKDAKKMLEIAASRINETAKAIKSEDKIIKKDMENLSLKDILEHDYVKGQKKLIIGRNWVYRYSKEIWNIVKFPFEFSAIVGRALINPVRKLFGKKPKEGPEKSSFYSEQFIKNVTRWADKVNKKMGIINKENEEEAIGRYAKNKKNFFSTAVMEYAPHELSTAMKFTGFVTVPFLATDAYNVTLGETKNKDSAGKKRNQRAVQDSARQGVSLWISYAFNQIGKALSSASLIGNAAVIAISAFSYESFTRKLVGQPLFPTTHEKMVEIEKEKAKSKNWFVKLMAGRLKTNSTSASSEEKPETAVKPTNTSNQSSAVFNLNSGSPNVVELYKKFSTNNK